MCCKREPDDADVIIIGAGISGLTAAFYILEHDPGLSIFILEATEQIGGRTHSVPLIASQRGHMRIFDFGGQYVSTEQVQMMRLLKELDLEMKELVKNEGKVVWNLEQDKIDLNYGSTHDLHKIKERIDLVQFFQKLNHMSKNISFDRPHLVDNTGVLDEKNMEFFIMLHLRDVTSQNYARTFVRITCGVEPTEISILFFLAYYHSSFGKDNSSMTAKKMTIKGGATHLCQKIASHIGRECISTNEPVVKISSSPIQVTVETEFTKCRYAVIAIPPPETKKIVFNPPLPASHFIYHSSCILGHLIKFVATYKTEFWKERGLNGEILSCGLRGGHGPIQVCFNVSTKQSAALSGLIASKDCTHHLHEIHQTAVLHQLAMYFGDDALHPLDYYEKSWYDTPYIGGCFMNSPGFQNMAKFNKVKEPLGRLFWAGTETASQWNGHMEGAVYAGYRAAIEILYDCRPQSLSLNDLKFLFPEEVEIEKTPSLAEQITRHWILWLSLTGIAVLIIYKRMQT